MSIAATTSPVIQNLRPGNRAAAGEASSGVGQATPENVLSVFAQLLKRTSATPNAENSANSGTHRAEPSGPEGASNPENPDSTQLAQALAQWLATWIAAQHKSTAQQGSTQPSEPDAPATASATLFAASNDSAAKLAAMLSALSAQTEVQGVPLLKQIQQMLEQQNAALAVQDVQPSESNENNAAMAHLRQTLAQLFADDRALRERFLTLLRAHEAAQGWREAAALLENALPGKGAAVLGNVPALPLGLAQWLANLDIDTEPTSTLSSGVAETPLWQRLLREWRQSDGDGAPPTALSALLKPADSPNMRIEKLTAPLMPNDAQPADALETQRTVIEDKLGLEKRLTQASGNADSLARADGRLAENPFATPGASTVPRAAFETIRSPLNQPAQWAMETAERLVWHAGQGVHKVELQLNPPHLGRLEVSLQLNQDHLTAHFVAATQAARDALDQALPRLRELLQQSGIQLGQSSVSSNGADHGGSTPWENPQHARSAWPSESALSTSVLTMQPESSRPPLLSPTVRAGRNAFDAWA
ncbi:flagellar hook-length control protein FliK [Hydrogenophilus thermoluteolus]|uniref:Flagellar hook-length control protein FliK n=1 Tax=Hydrogenophilus thermoluteolus TaxID=297 RepID=A0A2Z6DZ54_HYDTE|nr:flagellar hook-length control protein FliK [Hydrogenophilus thermoluteolus]BBD77763.1 flagellar hook-length control protein FliK [Hydrogenophilus thermoluteolus]